ncbi:hypothetical protein HPB48_003289 [Haemaphysalis longicornis]|uniref:Uncharacterized protein n=1 Tax=Haemaphysalis longicornis TaxID=44386 RepID=A0A9J6H3U6_HAELO|nr:hypothetical protein HPB48_003289 [Haemaphysalis longicornis]
MMPIDLSGALLENRRRRLRSYSVPRPLSAPACLNHLSQQQQQECPEFAHLCCARNHHRLHQCHPDPSGVQREQDLALLKAATIRQHYYPEGGWGWAVCACGFLSHALADGLVASHGFMIIVAQKKFRDAASAPGDGTSSMKLSEYLVLLFGPRALSPTLAVDVNGSARGQHRGTS